MKLAFSFFVTVMILVCGAFVPMLWEDSTLGNATPVPSPCPEPAYDIQINEDANASLIKVRNEILIRDLQTGQLLQRISGPRTELTTAVWVPKSSRILVGCFNGQLKMLKSLDAPAEVFSAHAHQKAILSLAVAKDGTRAVSGSVDRLCLWDLKRNRLIADFPMNGVTPRVLNFSPDGSRLLLGGSDGSLRIFQANDFQLLRQFNLTSDTVVGATFIEDGRKVISGHVHGEKFSLDVATGQATPLVSECMINLLCLEVSPGQQLIAYGDWTNDIHLYSLKTFRKIATLKGHTNGVSALCFSETEPLLYSSSFDGTVRIWDLNTFAELDAYQGSLPIEVESSSPKQARL